MKKYFISDGISEDSIEKMLRCFQPQFKAYRQGETIMRYSDQIKKIGLMTAGRAQLYGFDIDGESRLLEAYGEKDLFGELFYLPLENFEYIVEATTDCNVVFISYQHIITPCEKVCSHHSQLINNLFLMAAEKSQSLSLHLNVLNQPTIQKKLLAYLKYVRGQTGKNPFVIPMSLSALAEYLCVDRSAMMREIRSMKNAGILRASRREFFLEEKDHV